MKATRNHTKSYENGATYDEVEGLKRRKFVDKRDAAKILGVHPEHLTRLAKQGKIPGAFKVGNIWRFNPRILCSLGEGAEAVEV